MNIGPDNVEEILNKILEKEKEEKFEEFFMEFMQILMMVGLLESIKKSRPDLLKATKEKILKDLQELKIYKNYIEELKKSN